MLSQLLEWDKAVFHWINSGWSHPVLDFILPAFRNKYFWLPLYVFCIGLITYNFPWRQSLLILAFIGGGLFVSDTISSKLIKYEVKRSRPCQELTITPPVTLRVSCGSGYSFTSSHAANHFMVAAFMVLVFGRYLGRWKHLWWLWAGVISLSQVYVGVHYPMDIAGGAILGLLTGSSLGILCRHYLRKPEKNLLHT